MIILLNVQNNAVCMKKRSFPLGSWTRHFTLTVPANLMLGGNPAMDWYHMQGEFRNSPSRFTLQKPR